MQRTFDELGIELLKYGYRKIVFIEVECKIDGTYRLGVSAGQPIGDRFECPECHEQRPCSGILATGYSRKPLPLAPEFWYGSGNLHNVSEDEYRPRRRTGQYARHYRKTFRSALETDESGEAGAMGEEETMRVDESTILCVRL